MTEPPADLPTPEEDALEQRERRKQMALGCLSVPLTFLAVGLLAPLLGGNLAGLVTLAGVVGLSVLAYRRRGTGFGLGIGLAFGILVVAAGGLCIALIAGSQ